MFFVHTRCIWKMPYLYPNSDLHLVAFFSRSPMTSCKSSMFSSKSVIVTLTIRVAILTSRNDILQLKAELSVSEEYATGNWPRESFPFALKREQLQVPPMNWFFKYFHIRNCFELICTTLLNTIGKFICWFHSGFNSQEKPTE